MKDIEKICTRRTSTIRDAMAILNGSGLQLILLVDEQGRFERTVTDGDLRRLLLTGAELTDTLRDLPTIDSVVAAHDVSRKHVRALLDEHKLKHLPLLNGERLCVPLLDRRNVSHKTHNSYPHKGETETPEKKEGI